MSNENIYINIKIEKIDVLLTNGGDEIIIYTYMPSTFPDWLPNSIMSMSIKCAKNYGVQYVKDNFDIEPNVKNVRV